MGNAARPAQIVTGASPTWASAEGFEHRMPGGGVKFAGSLVVAGNASNAALIGSYSWGRNV